MCGSSPPEPHDKPRLDVLNHTERPSWDDYFMEIAHVVAKRSTCLSRQVGCVLVSDRRILCTGYNGPPKGLSHCEDLGGCLRAQLGIPRGQRQEVCRALHAEQNAIIQAAVHGVALNEVTSYTLTQPCVTCAKMLINAGVRRIVYRDAYPDELAQQILAEAGIELVQWQPAGEREG
jgi:dCMP deaminase